MVIDQDKLRGCSFIAVHAAPNGASETALREAGFEIPVYPEQGPILFGGRKVGHAANFNGLCFKDKDLVWKLRRVFEQTCFFYTN